MFNGLPRLAWITAFHSLHDNSTMIRWLRLELDAWVLQGYILRRRIPASAQLSRAALTSSALTLPAIDDTTAGSGGSLKRGRIPPDGVDGPGPSGARNLETAAPSRAKKARFDIPDSNIAPRSSKVAAAGSSDDSDHAWAGECSLALLTL